MAYVSNLKEICRCNRDSHPVPTLLQMFQIPAVIGMSISATRMYRSLTDFTDPEYYSQPPLFCPNTNRGRCCRSFHTYPTRMGHATNRVPKPVFTAAVPLNRVEVAVHTSSENYPPENMGQYAPCGTYSADSQSQDKPFVLDICSDRENDVKRG
jgi:hypothetical protein